MGLHVRVMRMLRRVDDTEKNARHYKHFSAAGVMGRMSERVMNGSHY